MAEEKHLQSVPPRVSCTGKGTRQGEILVGLWKLLVFKALGWGKINLNITKLPPTKATIAVNKQTGGDNNSLR